MQDNEMQGTGPLPQSSAMPSVFAYIIVQFVYELDWLIEILSCGQHTGLGCGKADGTENKLSMF